MKKALIVLGIVIAGAAVIFYFLRLAPQKEIVQMVPPPPVVNEYPYMTLVHLNGAQQMTHELTGRNILILYFPDCDHCQREATEISSHLKAFENYTLWFISTATFEENEKFARDYKLVGHDNIHFVRTEMQDVMSNFGSIPTPSVYIFSEDRKFVKAFNGETKIEEIIKFL